MRNGGRNIVANLQKSVVSDIIILAILVLRLIKEASL